MRNEIAPAEAAGIFSGSCRGGHDETRARSGWSSFGDLQSRRPVIRPGERELTVYLHGLVHSPNESVADDQGCIDSHRIPGRKALASRGASTTFGLSSSVGKQLQGCASQGNRKIAGRCLQQHTEGSPSTSCQQTRRCVTLQSGHFFRYGCKNGNVK